MMLSLWISLPFALSSGTMLHFNTVLALHSCCKQPILALSLQQLAIALSLPTNILFWQSQQPHMHSPCHIDVSAFLLIPLCFLPAHPLQRFLNIFCMQNFFKTLWSLSSSQHIYSLFTYHIAYTKFLENFVVALFKPAHL